MVVASLPIEQIKECVIKLLENAKVKIPEFPKETWNIEHHYISELFDKGDEQFLFAFKCNPALKEEEMKKMMVCCVIFTLSKGIEMEQAIMYEPVETVIDTIDSKYIISKCIKIFQGLLQDIENFYLDDDGS